MNSPANHNEKIFWVWSERRAREISIRLQYSVAEDNGCQLIALHGRDEWL